MIQGYKNFKLRGYVTDGDKTGNPSLIFDEGVYLQKPGFNGSASVGWYPRKHIYQGANIKIVHEIFRLNTLSKDEMGWFQRVIVKGVLNTSSVGNAYYCIRNSPKLGENGRFIFFNGAFISATSPHYHQEYDIRYAFNVLEKGEFSTELSVDEKTLKLIDPPAFESFGSPSCREECDKFYPNDKAYTDLHSETSDSEESGSDEERVTVTATGQIPLNGNIVGLVQGEWHACAFVAAAHAAYFNGKTAILNENSYETLLPIIKLFVGKVQAGSLLYENVLNLTNEYNSKIAVGGKQYESLQAITSVLSKDHDMIVNTGFFLSPEAVMALCNFLGLHSKEVTANPAIKIGLDAENFSIKNALYGLGSSTTGLSQVCDKLYHWVYVDDVGDGNIITWGKRLPVGEAIDRMKAFSVDTFMFCIRLG